MGSLHDKTFPGESAAYRAARDTLLAAEAALRQQIEAVAALRRALPSGGTVPCDYEFLAVTDGAPVLMSELFAPGKDMLVVYSYMYGPQATAPCPLCTSMLDSLDGAAPHLDQHVNLAVVARAPVNALGAVVRQRGWRNLRLLSAARNTYQPDYLAEDDAGNPWPNCCGRPAPGPNVADAASQAPNSRRGRHSHKLCNAHRPRRGLAATAAVSLTGRRVP